MSKKVNRAQKEEEEVMEMRNNGQGSEHPTRTSNPCSARARVGALILLRYEETTFAACSCHIC